MYRWLRPLLFLFPAEFAHRLGLLALRWLGMPWLRRRVRRRLLPDLPELATSRFGLTFPTPIGVAAGLDKSGTAASGLFALGFGFVEVGTVTPRPQPGNPKPRLFRIPADGALINRMGFNNPGAAAVARRISNAFRPGPLGVNIGRNKLTSEAEVAADYVAAARAVEKVADYLVVNVSSPNTPGLRDLQRAEKLLPLLRTIRGALGSKPLLLKFAPDLADADLDSLCDAAVEADVAGLIATNTTVWRPSAIAPYAEPGGLSGRPLRPLAMRALRRAFGRVGNRLPIVGVGGLESGADLLERLRSGACLLQSYTGLIYGGPGWGSSVTLGLALELRKAGFRSIGEAIGADNRSDAAR
jgi:dihydroorotate dehydrogenase